MRIMTIEDELSELSHNLGEIKINNDVVTTVAALAAVEIDGIVSLVGKNTLVEMWGRKDMNKGVTVEIGENRTATIHVDVNVEYGVEIYKAARQLQLAVKSAVETMTGLEVKSVNVTIRGIVLGDQPHRPSVAQESIIEPIAGAE